jgi:ABC-type multidrug transport system fused ATPase/permease subunit
LALKDFQEKDLGKVYDYNLIKRLLKYARPFILLFLISLIFLLVSVGTDLLRPYLLKITIDDYLVNDFNYFELLDDNNKFDLKIENYKFTKVNTDSLIGNNEKNYFTVFEYKNKIYFSEGIIDKTDNIKSVEKELLNDEEIKNYENLWYKGINNIGLIFISLIIIGFLMNFLHMYLLNKTSQTIIYNIRQQVFKHINKLPLSFFDKNPVGRIVTRITNDTEVINEMFTNVLINFIKDIAIFTGVIIFMFYLNTKLTIISLLSLPFVIIAVYIFRKYVREIYRKTRTMLAKINSILSEYISGMKIIKIFNKEIESIKKFNDISEDYFKITLKQIRIFGLFRPYINMVSNTTLAIIIWYGGLRIISNEIEFGVVIAFANYIGMLYQPINDLAEKFNLFQASMASSERIFAVLDEDVEKINNKNETNKILGDIEFKNVWFYYNNEDYVLKNVSFKVNKGETIAIVGATGSGKTTIINLLNYFYKIQKGYIKLDGIDIDDINTYFLRENISYVPQDVFLFKGTIADNIRLNDKDITDDEIKKACKSVNADKFIENFEDDYNHEVIEGGATLSTGQRQLISFARALVRNPSILVLDEATANIDTETEELIQKALDEVSKNRTTVIIAHRLSTIKKAGRILVMKKGEIVEEGNHNFLIKKEGAYYDLYNLQYNFKGDLE